MLKFNALILSNLFSISAQLKTWNESPFEKISNESGSFGRLLLLSRPLGHYLYESFLLKCYPN